MNSKRLQTQTLTALIFSGMILLAFILLILVPAFRTADQLQTDIESLRSQIEEQKVLHPVFKSLLKQVRQPNPEGIANPESGKLKRTETAKLGDYLASIASQNRLELERYQLDTDALMVDGEHMHVNLTLSGDFFDLRPFLEEVCQLPYIEKVEKLSIRTRQQDRQFDIQLLLAIE